ncbi:MAG: hypothetical protein H0W08_24325 [Acidobacteria bacterium]|nr:hypothetical protein [Acidobacteriota bacterium]
MAGTPGRSGGGNRLSTEQHLLAGTFRRDRHLQPIPAPLPPLSMPDRRRTLQGLPPTAHRIAKGLLDNFDGWSPAALAVCRSYGLSCERLERLEKLQSDPDDLRLLHAEIRTNLSLLKALDLEVR